MTTNRLTFMQSLVQLRMMNHEKTMRQMVEEIHRGKLNIDQAAAKFETTRKTVQHWTELVEEEVEIAKRLAQEDIPLPPPLQKRPAQASSQPNEANQVGELKAKVQALEEQLQTAKFKALYYATLVQVAEQELGIDIEKKSVTAPADRKPSGLY